MAVAQALAILPGLQVMEAEPEKDQEALQNLARWCHRVTPLASADLPDGLWLDVTGCAHLFGGESALLTELLARLKRDGLHARAAIADTPGAAHAVARFTQQPEPVIIAPGAQSEAVAELPVDALRLPNELVATLRLLGFEQIKHLWQMPRALLVTRFGPFLGLRLDQVQGRVPETLVPLAPDQALQRRICFLEPLLRAEALETAIEYLVETLCAEMERRSVGARQLDLLFERVDGQVANIRIGTAQPSRNIPHLVRLLEERLETVDPGLGVEAMQLIIPLANPLRWEQQEGGATSHDVARLVDRLINRLGAEHVYRVAPLESAIPERGMRKKPAETIMPRTRLSEPRNLHSEHTTPVVTRPPNLSVLACSAVDRVDNRIVNLKKSHLRLVDLSPDPPIFVWQRPWKSRRNVESTLWPGRLRVPARLLEPPRPIKALAALPDQPPVAFTWQRRRYRIKRSEGPERVHEEWWRLNGANRSVRDYFQVEDESGQRFWLFRQGNGLDLRTGNLSWFLHGLF